MNATCQFCRSAFHTQPHRIAMGRGKYCSKACKLKSPDVRKALSDKAKNKWISGFYPRTMSATNRAKIKSKLAGRKLSQTHVKSISARMQGNRYGVGHIGVWAGKKMPPSIITSMRASAKRGASSHLWRGGVTPLRKK